MVNIGKKSNLISSLNSYSLIEHEANQDNIDQQHANNEQYLDHSFHTVTL